MVDRSTGLEFEGMIEEIIRAHGGVFQRIDRPRANAIMIDGITTYDGLKIATETKLYRSKFISTSTILSILASLEHARRRYSCALSILFVGNFVDKDTKSILQREFPKIVVYDISNIRYLASINSETLKKIDDLIKSSAIFSDGTDYPPTQTDISFDISSRLVGPERGVPMPRSSRAPELCAGMRNVKPGKKYSTAFEQAVMKALQYIFEDDLTAWSTQLTSHTSLNRYDGVCRVKSSHDFWKIVVENFSSRYIIFEFKNYAKPITQSEIHTTEKYLYRAALRGTAFIVSRKGGDKNAHAAARGALRENGKLIFILSIDDICNALDLRDKLDDVNQMLMSKIDDMMMKLER